MLEMSAVKILRDIYQFADILNQAWRVDVKEWDSISIHNALNWADYLHEIYNLVQNQPCEKDLEHQLSQMTLLLEPVSCLRLTVQSLGQAKSLLVEALLSNPFLPVDLRSELVTQLRAREPDELLLSKAEENLATCVKLFKASEDLLRSLQQSCSSTQVCHVFKVKSLAKVLALQLCHIGTHLEKKERFKKYCHRICDHIADSGPWNLLVGVLCLDLTRQEDTNVQVMEDVAGHFITWMCLVKPSRKGSLLQVDRSLLAEASCRHTGFLNLYLQEISDWADSFLPSVTLDGQCLWQCPSGRKLYEVAAHFESLLVHCENTDVDKDKDAVRKTVLDCITSRVCPPEFTVWKPLAHAVLNSLRKG